MASFSSDDEGREIVGILTVEQRTGEILSYEYFDVVHAINGRIRGTKKGSQASTKLQGVDPIKTTTISIADLLRIVNEVDDQSILSEYDVLEKLQETRAPKGTYTDKVLFSASEEDNGMDWLDGSELEEMSGPSRMPAPTEMDERNATTPEGPRNDNAGEMAAEVSGHYEAQNDDERKCGLHISGEIFDLSLYHCMRRREICSGISKWGAPLLAV